jgi:excisionase family DNA binding protein
LLRKPKYRPSTFTAVQELRVATSAVLGGRCKAQDVADKCEVRESSGGHVSNHAAQRLLTVKDVAASTRLSETTVKKLIRSGDLASLKIGTCRRVPSDALESYLSGLAA